MLRDCSIFMLLMVDIWLPTIVIGSEFTMIQMFHFKFFISELLIVYDFLPDTLHLFHARGLSSPLHHADLLLRQAVLLIHQPNPSPGPSVRSASPGGVCSVTSWWGWKVFLQPNYLVIYSIYFIKFFCYEIGRLRI